ncbi:MAG: hypothetical protein B0W54_15565 [Cellvibrio sp. 79]|nr:MAG: hypothetical protein B0W54_15565 [Cellvibrio sp. 79]
MARAFLRWSIEDLANKSGVGVTTIKRMESFDGIPGARVENLQAIKDTFIATKKIKFENESTISVKE